jgi:hypothetical protein
MEVLCLQIQHEYVRKNFIERTRDVLSCLGPQIGRGIEWGLLLNSQVVLLRVRYFHIRLSCLRLAEGCRFDFSQETSALQAYRFCFSHGTTHKHVTPPDASLPDTKNQLIPQQRPWLLEESRIASLSFQA